jgi:RNA polymerase subunit RPABC4/transcription elongation factor Spt4
MNFIKKIWQKLKEYKESFFTINQTKLTGFSRNLMILFFFTSLWLIASGINSSIRELKAPQDRYGYSCIELISNPIDIFSFEEYRHEYFGDSTECKELETRYYIVKNDLQIQSNIKQIRLLKEKLSSTSYKINRLKNEYNGMLLEKISKQDQNNSILHANAQNAKEKLKKLKTLEKDLQDQISKLKNPLNYPKIQDFILYIDHHKKSIQDKFAKSKKYFILKKSAKIFAFLIPIWLLFYLLSKRFEKEKQYIFAQLSFYVTSAAALYGLIELVRLIYYIIPKVFLSKLIAFFTSHNMIIILNILGIIFFLALFGLIINIIQKNHEKKKKAQNIQKNRLLKGRCLECNAIIDKEDEFCSFCGSATKKECHSCHTKIEKTALFCPKCGEKSEH